MKNSWESVSVDGSPMRLYLSRLEGNAPFPAVLVIQNQDGVGEFAQEMTRRVAIGWTGAH
jgi:dienelactone hydrolase